MATRTEREVMFLKYEFNDQEKLAMATTLAQNHNAIDDLAAEEKVLKTQIAERRSGLAQSIQTLSRNISTGFEMRNIPCRVQWDVPNIGEVQYIRTDTGEVVRTRPMTDTERQIDLPLEAQDEAAVEASVGASGEAVGEFFENGKVENLAARYDRDEEDDGEGDNEDEDQSDEEYNSDISEPADLADDVPVIGEEPIPGAVAVKRGRGRPRKIQPGASRY